MPTPSAAEVADVARRTAERLGRAFEARGRPSPWEEADPEPDPEPLSLEQPGLFACYEAAARGLSVSGEPRAGVVLAAALSRSLFGEPLYGQPCPPVDPSRPLSAVLISPAPSHPPVRVQLTRYKALSQMIWTSRRR